MRRKRTDHVSSYVTLASMTKRDEESPTPIHLSGLVRDNIALTGAVATSLLILIHIWCVAHYDLTTATVLLQTTGTTNIIIASLVGIIPALLGFVSAGITAGWLIDLAVKRWQPSYQRSRIVPLVAFIAFVGAV